jgi:hypothetical protein
MEGSQLQCSDEADVPILRLVETKAELMTSFLFSQLPDRSLVPGGLGGSE